MILMPLEIHGEIMVDDDNPHMNVEEIMRLIKEEAARKKAGPARFFPGKNFDDAGVRQQRTLVVVRESPLFRALKKVQAYAGKLPFYPSVHSAAIKIKKFIPRYQEVLSLQAFYQYDDEALVHAAYRIILRREPDRQGYDSYLSRLKNGQLNKLELIGRIRYSREGRKSPVKIKGLLSRYVLYSIFRILPRPN